MIDTIVIHHEFRKITPNLLIFIQHCLRYCQTESETHIPLTDNSLQTAYFRSLHTLKDFMESGCSARYELYFQDVIFYKILLWKCLWQTEVSLLKYFERKCATEC